MKIGYADPPYIGCAHLYKDHPDFAGEVDHVALIDRLQSEYDGWILHASATAHSMAVLAPLVEKAGARWMTWVKGFAAFKRNVPVAYAWEPAKPEAVCHWAFEMVGARPDDELDDMFPGSGAVERAWRTWQGKFYLPANDGDMFPTSTSKETP